MKILIAAFCLLLGVLGSDCNQLESQADLTPILALNDPNVDCDESAAIIDDNFIHISLASTQCTEPKLPHRVLVMKNGANEGVQIEYTPGCAGELAKIAADLLGLEGGVPMYLHSRMGSPLKQTTKEQQEQVSCSEGQLHLLLEGETWVWGGVEIGHAWELDGVTFTTLALEPKVISVANIATLEQCDRFVEEAPNAMPSPEKHYSPGFENYRTSQTAFTDERHTTGVEMQRRAAWSARLPAAGWCENLQLVKYEPGQWYKKHQDYFHNYKHVGMGDAPRVQPNRHATLFFYLNDDFEGGETVFPYARVNESKGIVRKGMSECSEGLAVTPVKGSAALFYSRAGDGGLDPDSMHGGCPPVTGTKYGANAFMWNGDSAKQYRVWQKIFSEGN